MVPHLLEAVTGAGYDTKNTWLCGERIFNIERLFNLRAGLTSRDDALPPRITNEPMTEGASKGHVVRLTEMLPEYYEVRGWDKKGIPTLDKLKELGLEEEGKKLESVSAPERLVSKTAVKKRISARAKGKKL